LQESRVVRAIRKQLVKRTLDMLAELSNREDKTDYGTFWEAFGKNLKLGIIEDAANKEALGKLLRYVWGWGILFGCYFLFGDQLMLTIQLTPCFLLPTGSPPAMATA
jgi:hypothetical protein